MESTGVYWIPVFEILEQLGFTVVLVNARDVKHVPGRKTDVTDAQWLQRLHEYGLLRASFRPERRIAALRDYLRQRERLLDYAASHIQHMQKALMQMNLQLHHVVSDITGATGMRIIRAVVAGERNPVTLAALRDQRCKESAETIRQALVGNDREEHIFALAQAVELYDTYVAKVRDCDKPWYSTRLDKALS
jgi:transposase